MIKVIKTPADYDAAMERLEALVAATPEPGSPEAEQLELLGLLIEEYEAARQPAPSYDAVDAIRFRMEQLALRPRDLVPHLGSRSKVSEVLSRKRPLTLGMIQALHQHLRIPADVLLRSSVGGHAAQTTPIGAVTNAPTGTAPPAGRTGTRVPAHPAGGSVADPIGVAWERFPLVEMARRGWIPTLSPAAARTLKTGKDARVAAADLLAPLFAPLAGAGFPLALHRRGATVAPVEAADHVRGGRAMDEYALAAWTARVMLRASAAVPSGPFAAGAVEEDRWLDTFVGLSRRPDGPRAAVAALADAGIAVVVEPHLPRTQLDGAAFLLPGGTPVIGVTVRHDRLDNFWFTLCHELAHILLHLCGPPNAAKSMPAPGIPAAGTLEYSERPESGTDEGARDHQAGEVNPLPGPRARYYDDLDALEGIRPEEHQADEWAGEVLVPAEAWHASAVLYTPSAVTVAQLAAEIGVADAIVAGKARFERKNYRLLNGLVGHGAVRRLFPELQWPE